MPSKYLPRFPETEKISPPLLQMSEVTFGYSPEKIILKNVNIDVGLDSRIAIVGANGAGKSTLWVQRQSFRFWNECNLPSKVSKSSRENSAHKQAMWIEMVVYECSYLYSCISWDIQVNILYFSGYFSQHHVDTLIPGMTPVQFLASRFPGKSEQEYRQHLGNFQISGMTGLQLIGTLSGGQKSRVAFAVLSLQQPHILLLDEVN